MVDGSNDGLVTVYNYRTVDGYVWSGLLWLVCIWMMTLVWFADSSAENPTLIGTKLLLEVLILAFIGSLGSIVTLQTLRSRVEVLDSKLMVYGNMGKLKFAEELSDITKVDRLPSKGGPSIRVTFKSGHSFVFLGRISRFEELYGLVKSHFPNNLTLS